MTYFEDLTDYSYMRSSYSRPGTKNIGWLVRGHGFKMEDPSPDLLCLIWSFCSISVAQTRGIYHCTLCEPHRQVYAIRNGTRFLLGTSEIRVFAVTGTIYAAPSLIYHYVRTHHYRPPDEFLQALTNGPRPPLPEYFARLREVGMDWRERVSVSAGRAFRFERIDGKLERFEAPETIYVDED